MNKIEGLNSDSSSDLSDMGEDMTLDQQLQMTSSEDEFKFTVPKEEEDTLINLDIDADLERNKPDFGNDIYMSKLPPFLNIETTPFDETNFQSECKDIDLNNDEDCVKLKTRVENTIRWRINDKYKDRMESNAKMIKWTDGSTTLHIGKDLIQVHEMPIQVNHCYMYVKTGDGLTAQKALRHKLTFRAPINSSLNRRISGISSRFNNSQKVKVLNIVGKNPETSIREKIKNEEISLRNANKTSKSRNLYTCDYTGDSSKMDDSFLESDFSGSDMEESDISEQEKKPKEKSVELESEISDPSVNEDDSEQEIVRKRKTNLYDSD